MATKEQKEAARKFSKEWKNILDKVEENKSEERQFCQTFWIELLSKVFGIDDYKTFISFEKSVKKELKGTGFIDGYISTTKVIIEQKAKDVDLTKGYKQSDGQFLTPYQQAARYETDLNYDEKPKWIVVSNFITFEIHDENKKHSAPIIIKLEDLADNLDNLSFLYDTGKKEIKAEMELSVEAGKIVDEIYEALIKQYDDDSPETLKSLNMLCVRLVFLLYADDAELFGKKGMFHEFIESFNATNLRGGIKELFKTLNTKENERDKYADPKINAFPYVNGNLFSEEDNLIPQFTDEIKQLLLEKGNFNWKAISPTIFGAVFESTLNPETRHDGGMHYTSIENIHKVIDPLFLDDLKNEFDEIKNSSKSVNSKKELYNKLQDQLASIKIFDPACGSGNFLTESYISLRRLENQILQELGNDGLFANDYTKVSIQQFYGIEINDFAASVAKTALWIAQSQMLIETEKLQNMKAVEFFPLETFNNIREGNALRIDWKEVFTPANNADSKSLYIIGNPPFLGARVMGEEQKKDVLSTFGEKLKGVGNLDYVSCWYKKASDLMKNTQIKAALVSTNSVTQGEQPAILFKPLFDEGIKFNFAHRTFIWDSESTEKAHVHCVIIGFSYCDNKNKVIYDNGMKIEAKNINAYLLDAPNIFIESRNKPLCNVPEIGIGNKPIDGGNYLFTEDEMKEFIKKEPKSEKLFRRYVGSYEFINNKKRFCLWLGRTNPSELVKMPEVMKRIKAVEEFRLSSTSKPTQKLAEKPTRFHVENFPENDFLVIPQVSSEQRKYIPIGYLDNSYICSDKVRIFPNASLYFFGILTSNVHNAWMRAVCCRLKSDYSYTVNDVYNNFPFPEPTDEQKAKIEKTAQAILDARARYPDSSLGEMYSNLLLYPELNKAHKDNDKAVLEAYGFKMSITEVECVAKLFEMYEKLAKA